MTYTLGLSAFYHDSAAALLRDGELVAASQEERFTRRKHDPSFPSHAIQDCLNQEGIFLGDIATIAFYEQPKIKLNRLIETFTAVAPRGWDAFRPAFNMWLKTRRKQENHMMDALRDLDKFADIKDRLFYAEHHQSHAASAFYPSPFDEAAVLTIDGVGEWATTTLAIGSGTELRMQKQLEFPHSLGLLYAAFTSFTGFKINSGEYKVMGLAPYGTPRFASTILDHMIDLKDDGTFRLDMTYFDFCTNTRMTNEKFAQALGCAPRKAEQDLDQVHMDLAASIQAVTEEVILRLARSIRRETKFRNLCMAGGVALNCVANGKILREGIFDNIWIQPAAGDAGGAVGAAYLGHLTSHRSLPAKPKMRDCMKGSYLGTRFSAAEIEDRLTSAGAVFHKLSESEILEKTVTALAQEKAVGWFQGRMEFGPRALGARSILGDPRSASMQKTLNLKVKYRESFRPFAPSILLDHVSDWFDLDTESPYMLLVDDVAKSRQVEMTEEEKRLFGIDKLNIRRSEIPAVTHVDYSARIQTVDGQYNPRYFELLRAFYEETGCPVLVNTSFNVRGEPIVQSPEDAFNCFMGTGIEHLVIENFWLSKSEQNSALARNYETEFELD